MGKHTKNNPINYEKSTIFPTKVMYLQKVSKIMNNKNWYSIIIRNGEALGGKNVSHEAAK